MPSRRPGSASWGDIYGGLSFANAAQAGTTGAVKGAALGAANVAPVTVRGIGPDLLAQPAGALVALVVGLAVWSYFEKG